MYLEFPFEYAQVEGLGQLFYPTIQADIKTIRGWREFGFLVDTGADITTVPTHLLPILGLTTSDLQANTTFGVGGFSVRTWNFTIPLRFGVIEMMVSCSAVETKHDSMPLLLGRKDVFEKDFNLLLDSKNHKTIITSNL